LNLSEAITERIIIPSTWESHSIWICSICGAYVCYAAGKYVFSCACHNDRL
jgi:hypothetical protein